MQKQVIRQSCIRGIVGNDFEIEDIYSITQSFLIWLSRTHTIQKIAVGMDGRLHSAALYDQVAQAVVDAGYQVYFVGICPTPVLVHALYDLPVQAGIMITGSGSDKIYNGLKLYVDQKPVEGTALEEIYTISLLGRMPAVANKGKIIPCPIIDQYLSKLWQEFAHLSEYDFTIVIDVGHGVTGFILQKLIMLMGWTSVVLLHADNNGLFPAHIPDPADYKNLEILKKYLYDFPQAFGVSFDGDGDRLSIVDEKGVIVSCERLIAIFARDILVKNSTGTIAHNVIDSVWLDYVIQINHGKVVTFKDDRQPFFSSSYQSSVIYAGQRHGKFYFYDRHPGYPDAIYSFLRLLDILVQQRSTIHDILVKLPKKITGVGSISRQDIVEQNYQE